MHTILWRGLPPPAAVAARLRRGNLRLVRSEGDSDAAPLVVCTKTRRLPAVAPGRQGWIWATTADVGDARTVEAVLQGAYAVVALDAPSAGADLLERLQELLTLEPASAPLADIVMQSDAARRTVAKVARVAPTAMPVLLTGETGSGKEIIARLIHAWSPRSAKTFVPINCAAIPNELMEAELFGYSRGAFSGAVQRYDGQLMAGEGGTVFLDEIHDTPPETQVKLLRVLEDRVVSRLGENVWHQVDFRLLAATNRDLRALIEAGQFGEDLYERLAIVTIHLRPLRERLEDLPLLAQHFMERFAREQGRRPLRALSGPAVRALSAYPWPGNIRELRNVIYETLVYKRAGDEILLSDLPRRILRGGAQATTANAVDRSQLSRRIEGGTMNLRSEVAALERAAIEEALKQTGGNAAQAARLLGQVGRGVARDPGSTLRAMIRRLGHRNSKMTAGRSS